MPAAAVIFVPAVVAAAESGFTTLLLLFVAEALSWAGVPAIGAAGMAAAGLLASQGDIRLSAVLLVATFGAEVGGILGWHVGRRLERAGHETRRDGRFATRREHALDAGERFEQRWGRLAVFFVPAWVSGTLGMPFGQFALWNLIAAALWVLAAGLGAYGLGSAVTGGTLLDVVVPIAIAVVAFATLVLVFVLWRRRRAPTRPSAATGGGA